MKQKQTIENHVWDPLKEHKLTGEEVKILVSGDYEPWAYAEVLQRLDVGEYLDIRINLRQKDMRNSTYLQNYVRQLQNHANVGKRDAEYGFKMPLPKNRHSSRELIIFRRSKKS